MKTFELADGLPPVGGDVPLAAGDGSNEIAEEDRVDWDDLQSDGAESSQGEHEVPPQGNLGAGSTSRAAAKDIVHLDAGMMMIVTKIPWSSGWSGETRPGRRRSPRAVLPSQRCLCTGLQLCRAS
jgi:hypothetical protein